MENPRARMLRRIRWAVVLRLHGSDAHRHYLAGSRQYWQREPLAGLSLGRASLQRRKGLRQLGLWCSSTLLRENMAIETPIHFRKNNAAGLIYVSMYIEIWMSHRSRALPA